MFANELFNNETVEKFIESSFNGNVLYLDPLDEKRAMEHFRTSQYVDKICTDKSKIMSRIHKVGYGSIFSSNFKVNTIDKRLQDLEIDEKLMIIDRVIDYLQENFRDLSTEMPKSPGRQRHEESNNDSGLGDEAAMMSAQGNNVSAKQAMKNHQQKKKKMAQEAFAAKLLRMGVHPSDALSYKKQLVVRAEGKETVRVINREMKQKML